MKVLAYAKINLVLKILGKRPDGFHALETLMIPISLHDELEVDILSSGSGIQLSCSDPSLPCDESNLAWKAANAYLKDYPIAGTVNIHLTKKTPSGAGLGGGSSDAASVLMALRDLDPRPDKPSDQELARIASTLGSDIPFFIYRQPAWCRGRGEIIEPTQLEQHYEGVLVHPGFSVPTPWAYKTYAENPGSGIPGKTTADVTLQNDLEPPVFKKYLWIPEVKSWFQQQPEVFDAMMSGSGSSVFALTHKGAHRDVLKKRFIEKFGAEAFVTLFEGCP